MNMLTVLGRERQTIKEEIKYGRSMDHCPSIDRLTLL